MHPPRPQHSLLRYGRTSTALSSLNIATVQSSHSIRPTFEPVLSVQTPSVSTQQRRAFHDYFVTHLPSSSLHPDSRNAAGPGHKLPRDQSTPHTGGSTRAPATLHRPPSRELTTVRIPLRGAKHHFGVNNQRGTRPYNEDTHQAGTIEIPAFARRPPANVSNKTEAGAAVQPVDAASGDPQVFYFGVFDGHGGDKCSIFLREKLHEYVEGAAKEFDLQSTLKESETASATSGGDRDEGKQEANKGDAQEADLNPTERLEKELVDSWRSTVGGYFRRFKPDYFSARAGGAGQSLVASLVRNDRLEDDTPVPFTSASSEASNPSPSSPSPPASIESVLTYSFLRADLDFVTAQAHEAQEPHINTDPSRDSMDDPSNLSLGRHMHHSHPRTPFLGGSTCSIALISTPTSAPFWAPTSPFSLMTAHCGDTRIILCHSASGVAIPLTSTHHPSTPVEAARLRRYAGAFTTDSFGEERVLGLANTRAFGDARSKRVGVSAEPEVKLLHAKPGEFSFMILISDGVTAVLSDQEVVDVVKEAKTPEQGARAVVALAVELSAGEQGDADNATAMCVRMGGWERRGEGGGGSLGTKEQREWRRNEANNPRGGRR